MGKSNVAKKTKRLTVGATLVALGVVLLWLGAVVEVLDLSVAAIASLITVFCVIEYGGGMPWAVWLCTSFLALLLLPLKFPALLYLLFAGVYPMAKAIFERRHYIIAWVLKLSMFNTALLILIALTKWVLRLPDSGMEFSVVVFAVANVTFVLYDIALGRMILLYMFKLRPRLKL